MGLLPRRHFLAGKIFCCLHVLFPPGVALKSAAGEVPYPSNQLGPRTWNHFLHADSSVVEPDLRQTHRANSNWTATRVPIRCRHWRTDPDYCAAAGVSSMAGRWDL